MPNLPRLITHRPDLLHLTDWAYTDGRPHRAAWLDVTETIGADWHTPTLVLVDIQCLPMLEALYGPRTGTTIALAADTSELPDITAARTTGRIDGAARADHWPDLGALTVLLDRYATGTADHALDQLTRTRPATPMTRPQLRLAGPCHPDPATPPTVQAGRA